MGGSSGAKADGGCTNTTEDQGKIILFGDPNHKAYLGCLNCSETAIDSIMNESGEYGNRYSWKSVLNKNGEFGSPNSNEGICNPFATDPPVIVDQQGRFYGRFVTLQLSGRPL